MSERTPAADEDRGSPTLAVGTPPSPFRGATDRRTIRPNPAFVFGFPMIWAWMLYRGWYDDPITGASDVVAAVFLVIVALLYLAVSIRERVVIDGDEVRIIRLWTEDRLRRSGIVRVVQKHDRSHRQHIVLAEDAVVNSRIIDLTCWPPHVIRRVGHTQAPSLMTARRLAKALDVPVTAYDGRPLTYDWWADEQPEVRNERGHILLKVWVTGILLSLAIGFTIACIWFTPGP